VLYGYRRSGIQSTGSRISDEWVGVTPGALEENSPQHFIEPALVKWITSPFMTSVLLA
jgi:hypothetical protein